MFSFKSHLADGLLLYQDDKGSDAFMELKLATGELKMRLKLNRETILNLEIGENLADRFVKLFIQLLKLCK